MENEKLTEKEVIVKHKCAILENQISGECLSLDTLRNGLKAFTTMNILQFDGTEQKYFVLNADLAHHTIKVLENCVHFCTAVDNFDKIHDSISAKL